MRALGALTVGAAAVLLAACGGTFGGSGDEVTVTGTVFSDHHIDLPCEELTADPLRPEELSGIRLVFTDGTGNALGEAVTGDLEWRKLDYGCRFLAAYSVTLPRRAAYRIDFEPKPPRGQGAMYLGAEDLEPQGIRHAELEERGFEWSFEAEPSYGTP
jgi:hypothetical protein